MNSRSCDVMTSAPSKSRRNGSSQRIDSRSRWLVGSSSRSASGRIEQDARERDAHLPAAGERCRRRRPSTSCAEAEAREDFPRPRLERVAAELVEARLRVAEALDELLELVGARRVGHRVLERVQLVAASDTSPAPAIVSATTRASPSSRRRPG